MKNFVFDLDQRAVNEFFVSIRGKRALLDLLISAVKYMLINPKVNKHNVVGEMRLYVAKMSRIFFFSGDKYFSINFPFQVSEEGDGCKFYSRHLEVLDNKITSELLTIIRSDELNEATCVLDFYSEFVDLVEYSEEIWCQFLDLLRYEDGYIRFDHDPVHENGNHHPLNHLDIFYSNATTFKVGTSVRLSREGLVDLLDVSSECAYISGR